MSKKKKPAPPATSKPQPSPTFRPLAQQLEKLAQEKKRADEAAKQKAIEEAKAKDALRDPRRGGKPLPKPAPQPTARASTLTRDEQRELDAMSRDDDFFFRRLMSGVVPLDEDKRGRVTSGATNAAKKPVVAPQTPQRDPDEDVRDRLMELVEGATRFEVIDDGKRLLGRRLDLSPSVWRAFREGQMSIDARIDLHGKTSDEARTAIDSFLKERRARKDRVALVVHGRGEHSPAGIGVLRGEIAAWLSQGRASQHVAAFATARADDGGEGALYVLIRP
jgi:DNA-nicking Smr family endonuclease